MITKELHNLHNQLAAVCLCNLQCFFSIGNDADLVLARPGFLVKCSGEMCEGEVPWWWQAGCVMRNVPGYSHSYFMKLAYLT